MTEPLATLLRPRAEHPSEALTARAAALARRLAQVMVANCTLESGGQHAAEFLTGWADAVATDDISGAQPVTMRRLAERLGLGELERELVVLAGLAEEHQGIAATFRSLHPTGEPWPTLGLAALLLGGSAADSRQLRAMVAEGTAFGSRLLRASTAGPFFERSLLLADGLWQALHGHDAWPTNLPRLDPGTPPRGLDGWLHEPAPRRALTALVADQPALVLVTSEDEAVGLARCSALADAAGLGLLAARLDPADPAQLCLLSLHATVRNAVPVAVVDRVGASHSLLASFGHLTGAVVICSPPGAIRPVADRPVVWLPSGPVSGADQREAWRTAVPDLSADTADALATRHQLDPAITAQLGLDVRALEATPSRSEVSALIRTRLAATLPPGVQLITPDVPWSDVVLPTEGASQLADAVARLDHESQVLEEWGLARRAHAMHGARLLLCGPPGTGKSLAARAVATAAATDLLVVDVSLIVSKWLGETEKNLSAAFDAAERSQAVLMLDEADALFGTRTEISDAHDRYANLETAYLLARLDRFEGLTILTTNMRGNIDPAFMRRIDYLVDFPLPDRDARTELWRRHLPPDPLGDDVEFDVLAGLYPVSGAWIRNVSVAGAFSAAANGGVITQEHLVSAMRREYAKASIPFPGVPPRRRHEPAR